jgi:hypothetical protein
MPITINGTTGISGVDGSAGTPAVIGSDADTGLVFAAGQVSASLNGVAGNVPLVQGTAQASTSGTVVDFTGIPSWARRITVMFDGVSTSGTSGYLLQLGDSGGVENTGYACGSGVLTSAGQGASSSTAGFLLTGTNPEAAALHSGLLTVANVTGNTWALAGNLGSATSSRTFFNAGSKTLSATLDRVRITTVNGTDTFDAGSINIFYE